MLNFEKKWDFEVKFEEIQIIITSKLIKIDTSRLLRFEAHVINILNKEKYYVRFWNQNKTILKGPIFQHFNGCPTV